MTGSAGGLSVVDGQVVQVVQGQSAGGQVGADSWPLTRNSVRALSGLVILPDRGCGGHV